MGGIATQLPGINSLIGMINSRRRRDSMVLGSVVGVCTLFLLFIVFR